MEVADVVPEFAEAFPFEEFNEMQRAVLPALLEGEDNVVASAPTASGKTALAELAICRALAAGGTALFIAPMRALTTEKEEEWDRFEKLGYSVYVVTGERDLNPRRAARADVLVMTPEKADSATRKHDSPRYAFIRDIDVCVVDEVHLLDAEKRGPVLEVTVARLRRLCDPRFVALSATMPNVEDVAAWLDAPQENTFAFGDEHRPVELHTGVRTYSKGENAFADKYRRLYAALDLAEPHLREDGQALVFVSSRRDTVQAAKKARDEIAERDVPIGARGDYDFHNETQQLENDTLRQSVLDGVAFHHAGLSRADREAVEAWFRDGTVAVLFSTTTLAWGVNLPARCVVLRDTKLHDPLEGEVDMNPLDVLQMLGRAGRPEYDDVGYGWVVCAPDEADKYRDLLEEGTDIESRLPDRLAEHVNAEVALGTVADVEDVGDWLETTFYYVRAESDPDRYPGTLRERAREAVAELVDGGFVEQDGLDLSPTPLGRLTSTYYLRPPTARRFADLAVDFPREMRAAERRVLRAVAAAEEFDSVSARSDEREAIDPLAPEDMEPGARKVFAILRASMRGSVPEELSGDAWVIRQNALRLVAAMGAFAGEFDGPRDRAAVRRIEARIEHGVPRDVTGLVAIDGVASGRAHRLADRGIDSPAAVREVGPDRLEAAGLSEGVARRVHETARDLPRATVDWGGFPDAVGRGENSFEEVTVRNEGDGARVGVRVTVNGVEMTARETYLADELTVPVGVFGAADDELEFAVEVAFPEYPLAPVVETRTVRVD